MKKVLTALSTLSFLVFGVPHSNATTTYELIELSGNAPENMSGLGWAFDINDKGVIVGEWYLGTGMYIDPLLGSVDIDLGSIYEGINYESIAGINNNNDLIAYNGRAYIEGIDGAFTAGWFISDGDDRSLTQLQVGTGTLHHNYSDGPYTDIDDNGDIIERIYDGPSGIDLLDLLGPDTEWGQLTPTAMNIHGQIVGWGFLESDWLPQSGFYLYQPRPFLINPVDYSVPAPASLALLGLGLMGVGFSRCRKVK